MMIFSMYVLVAVFICRSAAETFGLESQSVYYGLALTASRNESSDTLCKKQLVHVEDGITNKETWALKLLDASGAPRTGMYWGNTYWLGSKKQCISSMVSKDPLLDPSLLPFTHESEETIPPFPVDYYAAYFVHNSTFQIFVHADNETKITLGLCLPSSCTEDEVSDYLQEYFDSGVLLQLQIFNMTFTMDGVKKTRQEFSWTHHPMSIIFVMSTAVIACLIVAGTIYDLWIKNSPTGSGKEKIDLMTKMENFFIIDNTETNEANGNKYTADLNSKPSNVDEVQLSTDDCIKLDEDKSKLEKLILSFSWIANIKEILNTNPRPGTLMPFNGLRVIFTSSIILAHTFLFSVDYNDNKGVIFINDGSKLKEFMANNYAVDIFIYIGGFMMVYSLLRSKNMDEEVKQTQWSLFKEFLRGVFRRFKRLTPVYMFILGLVFTNTSYRRSSTPFWTNEENDIQCAKYWWTNLLYINNIYPGAYNTMCMSWSYYSSSDMQFFIVCSFLLFLSRRYFKTATTILFGLLIASCTLIGLKTFEHNYKPFLNNFYATASIFYYPPWMRIGPYIVGCATGYLYKRLNGELKMKTVYIYLLWIASASVIIFLFFGFTDRNLPMFISVAHTSLNKTVFAVALSWMTIACLTGHGGALVRILSIKQFLPISQLTYTAYLINPVVVYTMVSSYDAPWHIEDTNLIFAGNGVILMTYIVSFILVISVEMPFNKVIDILTEKRKKKTVKVTLKEDDKVL